LRYRAEGTSTLEELAVEAVISEPISAALIPCSAGKYSEFVNLHLKCGVGLPDGNSIAYQQNSYTAKQRRCPGKQGSSFAKQGHAMSACGAVGLNIEAATCSG